jgi:serine/threonine protein kinase
VLTNGLLYRPADLVLKGVVRVEDIAPIDEKVDVWSFGVTVYELVTGVQPCFSCAPCPLSIL